MPPADSVVQAIMASDIKTRKADKQRNLEQDYERRLKDLLEEVEEVRGNGNELTTSTRSAHLFRLRSLVNKKTSIEKALLKHTSELSDLHQGMRNEFAAVLEKRLEDIVDAETKLHEISETNGKDQDGNQETQHGQDHIDHRDGVSRQGENVKKAKGKVRISDRHAGGDRPTGDREGIITNVPGREQVKRAEELARQGRRA